MPLSLQEDMFSMEEFLTAEQEKELVRFSTAGSVDDGKSTLIGRLLYDSQNVYEDHVRAVTKAANGNVAAAIDFAQLTDGLRAEREQGITIDVAYRYFSTTHRKFIIADTPGHEQYTRNMATGASTADVAIILVDARKGILTQSRRHAYIASLLGTRHIVAAVNKMDLVDYSSAVFFIPWLVTCSSWRRSWAFPVLSAFPSAPSTATMSWTAARTCHGTKVLLCSTTWRQCPPGMMSTALPFVYRSRGSFVLTSTIAASPVKLPPGQSGRAIASSLFPREEPAG